MSDVFLSELAALGQVVFIDLVLAGDNAIVVGMAAAGVAPEKRTKVIFWGIVAAVLLRIVFAALTTQLLAIIGLTFAGGVLLLWVCWKLYRELRQPAEEAEGERLVEGVGGPGPSAGPATKSMGAAIWQVVVADVSMSLDNVLAVAGAAREHIWVLVIGLILSVGLMGAAASVMARVLARYHWIAYVGLAVIGYVAVRMIWEGGGEILAAAGQL